MGLAVARPAILLVDYTCTRSCIDATCYAICARDDKCGCIDKQIDTIDLGQAGYELTRDWLKKKRDSIVLKYVSSIPTRTVVSNCHHWQFDDTLRQLFGLELRMHISR